MQSIAKHNFPSMLVPAEQCPPESPAWAESMSFRFQMAIERVSSESTAGWAREIAVEILHARPPVWERFPEKRPYGTPAKYCKAVTGMDWDVVIETIANLTTKPEEREGLRRAARRVQADAEAEVVRPGNPLGTNQHTANVGIPDRIRNSSDGVAARGKDGGTSSDYLLRRLARERPDVLEQWEAGDFKSVKAAARAAGFVAAPKKGADLIKAEWPRLTSDEQDDMLDWLVANRRKFA